MPRHVDSIKCGCCKQRHTTVAQVALCHKAKRDAEAKADDERHEGMIKLMRSMTPREEHDAKVRRQADVISRMSPPSGGMKVLADCIPEVFYDMLIQRREIEQDQAAAEAKMDRGFTLGGTRRRRPW